MVVDLGPIPTQKKRPVYRHVLIETVTFVASRNEVQNMKYEIQEFIDSVGQRNPHQPEFLQAVKEFAQSAIPFVNAHPRYADQSLLERMVEPNMVYQFSVEWVDDQNTVQVNKGYRVQYNNAIGPYKGGLRFHPSVNLSILKFLGFEQIFKNSLTTLAMGGGKGGSDFDPKGKSDGEVMRFCQAFMTKLALHIGADTDVPAGDIGVGGREIGYMYGQYKKLRRENTGVLTGKGLSYGGSLIRPEATGYGCVYFASNMLEYHGDSMETKTVCISGSGNVAQYAAEKCMDLGAKVLSLSDSGGSIYDEAGLDREKLAYVMDLKNNKRGRIREYAEKYDAEYLEGARPWKIKCDIALPCATQNELELEDAQALVANGCMAVAEGANMPTSIEATELLQSKGVLFAPGKASNAGGVATSGLEMSQNSMRLSWTRDEVDEKLKSIMQSIHEQCVEYGRMDNGVDYVKGANIAGFIKVADAMLAQGI